MGALMARCAQRGAYAQVTLTSSPAPQPDLELEPLHFLQCHSKNNSPRDLDTQLWACAFEPAWEEGTPGVSRGEQGQEELLDRAWVCPAAWVDRIPRNAKVGLADPSEPCRCHVPDCGHVWWGSCVCHRLPNGHRPAQIQGTW